MAQRGEPSTHALRPEGRDGEAHENQAGGENVHETLEPEVSADIVRAHVRDGVELCEQYGVPPADAYPAFDVLVAAYTAPERHYHNLEHLGEMFRVAERLSASVDDPHALHLAIWFHDAVYDSRAKDNENEIAGRMKTAERELQEAAKFDHRIESRTRDEDFAALLDIVEKARAHSSAPW